MTHQCSFEVSQSAKDGQWRWRILGSDHRTLAKSSQCFDTVEEAREDVRLLKEGLAALLVSDDSAPVCKSLNFRNEYGNCIEISVKTDDNDTELKMVAPRTTTEWNMTSLEGQVLFALMEDVGITRPKELLSEVALQR